jgi:DNA end-binding protein Ku
MSEHWNPSEFKDTYHEDLMARIHEKIKLGQTKEITKPEAEGKGAPRSAEVIDLAELLKKSLDKGASGRKPPARAEAPARGQPKLRVVAGGPAVAKRSAKPASRRKRA